MTQAEDTAHLVPRLPGTLVTETPCQRSRRWGFSWQHSSMSHSTGGPVCAHTRPPATPPNTATLQTLVYVMGERSSL